MSNVYFLNTKKDQTYVGDTKNLQFPVVVKIITHTSETTRIIEHRAMSLDKTVDHLKGLCYGRSVFYRMGPNEASLTFHAPAGVVEVIGKLGIIYAISDKLGLRQTKQC